MKLLSATVNNFGSYKHLEFDFQGQGLSLIYGATGSGKSTLQDIATWILFGVTSKDGNVDEIRSWNSDEPTTGTITIETQSGIVDITRIRGTSSQNDLFFNNNKRGKDITETQELLEDLLGVNKELYMSAACYNEFSPTLAFFTTTAKNRRALFDNIADLTFPIQLQERLTNEKKGTRKALSAIVNTHNKNCGRLEQLKKTEGTTKEYVKIWDASKERTIKDLKEKSESFEKDKAKRVKYLIQQIEDFNINKLEVLDENQLELQQAYYTLETFKDINCPTCNQPNKQAHSTMFKLRDLESRINILRNQSSPLINELLTTQSIENTYQDKIENELAQVNPYLEQLGSLSKEMDTVAFLVEHSENQMNSLDKRLNSLDHLGDLSSALRGELLKQAIKTVEINTNKQLSTYFDSEIKVDFALSNADNLDISIKKNGYDCVYKQLSKGQRGLLKLCFAVSIMEAASNASGIHFDTLMFDESLDGLDSDLKLKAFNLFSELSKRHSSILVIDHSEGLQNLFDNKFHVTLENDISSVEKI